MSNLEEQYRASMKAMKKVVEWFNQLPTHADKEYIVKRLQAELEKGDA